MNAEKEKTIVTLENIGEYAGRVLGMLSPGDVILLSGGLGAGKSTFTRELCARMGVAEIVSSPTFTIINEYHGKLAGNELLVRHADLYRLDSADDLYALGFDEMIAEDGVLSLIEWGDKLRDFFPRYKEIRIERLNENEREFSLIGFGGNNDCIR